MRIATRKRQRRYRERKSWQPALTCVLQLLPHYLQSCILPWQPALTCVLQLANGLTTCVSRCWQPALTCVLQLSPSIAAPAHENLATRTHMRIATAKMHNTTTRRVRKCRAFRTWIPSLTRFEKIKASEH